MTISINVQPNQEKTLLATSRSFDGGNPFVTFEVTVIGEGSVSVFLRSTDDARTLMDAALEAYKNVIAQETEKVIAKAKAEAAKFTPVIKEYDPELERLLDEEEAIEARYKENYGYGDDDPGFFEGPCECHLCVEQF